MCCTLHTQRCNNPVYMLNAVLLTSGRTTKPPHTVYELLWGTQVAVGASSVLGACATAGLSRYFKPSVTLAYSMVSPTCMSCTPPGRPSALQMPDYQSLLQEGCRLQS